MKTPLNRPMTFTSPTAKVRIALILDLLRESSGPIESPDVAAHLGVGASVACTYLSGMHDLKLIHRIPKGRGRGFLWTLRKPQEQAWKLSGNGGATVIHSSAVAGSGKAEQDPLFLAMHRAK